MTTNVQTQYLTVGPFPLDAKMAVGNGYRFETIQELIVNLGDTGLSEGMIVADKNYSVSWQVYKDGSEWKYRLHQGMFYVDAVHTTYTIDPESETTLETIDGVAGADGNVILIVNEFYPKDNGVWIMHDGSAWERHPVFDEDSDQIGGMYFKVKNGTVYKNSLWMLSNYGDITIGTTSLYFEQVLIQTQINSNSITSPVKYINFSNTIYDKTITTGLNLIPGMEYICRKTTYDDYTIVIRTAGSFNYVGTLNKKDDWIRFIPTTGYSSPQNWFITTSHQKLFNEIAYVSGGPTGNIYLEKENVYVYLGVNGTAADRDVYLPIDCYDDFTYYIFHVASLGKYSKIWDYDGVLLSHLTNWGEATLYLKPALTKYCTAKNTMSADGEMLIKIPPAWQLKDIIVEHVPTTVEATGSFTCSTADPTLGDTFTIGDETYTLVTSRTNKYEVILNTSPGSMASSIASTINQESKYVTAVVSSLSVNLTAKYPYVGTLGNAITITESSTGLTVSGATLTGGTTTWPGAVTISIGTTSGGSDLVSSQNIAAQSINTFTINKVLSLTDAKTLYISSANWNGATVNVYATRDEGISNTL